MSDSAGPAEGEGSGDVEPIPSVVATRRGTIRRRKLGVTAATLTIAGALTFAIQATDGASSSWKPAPSDAEVQLSLLCKQWGGKIAPAAKPASPGGPQVAPHTCTRPS